MRAAFLPMSAGSVAARLIAPPDLVFSAACECPLGCMALSEHQSGDSVLAHHSRLPPAPSSATPECPAMGWKREVRCSEEFEPYACPRPTLNTHLHFLPLQRPRTLLRRHGGEASGDGLRALRARLPGAPAWGLLFVCGFILGPVRWGDA
jgi:hypothetical protein